MSIDDKNRERKFSLWGWLLFLVCAGFFIASAIEGDNVLGLAGSTIFLVGCIIFIIPLVTKKNRDEGS